MQLRSITAAVSAGFLVLGLAACSSGDSGTTAFRVAFNQDQSHPQAQAILDVAEELDAATGGAYTLELFADATLGDQESTLEQVQNGTIDFAIVAGSLLENLNPDYSVVNLPYLYETPEHQMSVLNDWDIMGDLYGSTEDAGVQILAAYHGGVRNVYTAEGPVSTPDDLAGQKIRVIGSDTNVRMMELMGGVGTPMAQDEVFTAIQSGVIDGGENNELIYSSLSHDEIASFYSRTEHLMMPDFLVVNPGGWSDIDADVRTQLEELLSASVDTELAAFGEAVEAAIADAEAAGAEFGEVDVDAFRDAVVPLHEELVTSPTATSIYGAIEDARD